MFTCTLESNYPRTICISTSPTGMKRTRMFLIIMNMRSHGESSSVNWLVWRPLQLQEPFLTLRIHPPNL